MISKFSVKKPFTVFVAIIIVIILGVVSYTKMTVDLIPSLNLPYAVIVTTYGGASPEQVETVITSPLEQTLASISNIQTMSSSSMENVSMIMMEFAGETNMDSAMIEMREQMDLFTSNPSYPDEAGSPMIIKVSMNLLPVEVLTASVSNMEQAAATQFIEDKILPEIKSVGGVASVSATGLLENMADVTLSKEKIEKLAEDVQNNIEEQMMAAVESQLGPEIEKSVGTALAGYGITPSTPGYQEMFDEQYKTALEATLPGALEMARNQLPSDGSMDFAEKINVDMIKGILSADNFSMPAGSVIDSAGYSYAVKVGDKYATIQEFGQQILFNIPGYGDVKVDDIANITEYNNLESLYSKVNGNPAVMFMLMKQPEYSTVDVTNAVDDKINELMEEYDGLEISILMNQGEYVNIMINSISQNLLIGALLAVIILVIFLRRFRPTVIVGASILISLVFAVVLMYFGGVSMNLVSMGGLLLAVGMLVDNSIVVIENIFRLRGEGKSPVDAAIDGSKQVAGAITASTLTTIVVFVPIVFTTGLTKQLFTDMALTIGFSLVASLLVALTLVPSTTAMVKPSKKDSRVIGSHKLADF